MLSTLWKNQSSNKRKYSRLQRISQWDARDLKGGLGWRWRIQIIIETNKALSIRRGPARAQLSASTSNGVGISPLLGCGKNTLCLPSSSSKLYLSRAWENQTVIILITNTWIMMHFIAQSWSVTVLYARSSKRDSSQTSMLCSTLETYSTKRSIVLFLVAIYRWNLSVSELTWKPLRRSLLHCSVTCPLALLDLSLEMSGHGMFCLLSSGNQS